MSLSANITAANARRRRSQSVHKGECGEIGHCFCVKKKKKYDNDLFSTVKTHYS